LYALRDKFAMPFPDTTTAGALTAFRTQISSAERAGGHGRAYTSGALAFVHRCEQAVVHDPKLPKKSNVLRKRTENAVFEGLTDFQFSMNGKKVVVLLRRTRWIVDAAVDLRAFEIKKARSLKSWRVPTCPFHDYEEQKSLLRR
jgi:hypothetical protein